MRTVAISPDGQTVVSGSWDQTVKIWDWVTGRLKATLTAHSDRVGSVAITPDGQTIISGGADGTIKVWDLTTQSLKTTINGYSSAVYSVTISSNGQTVALVAVTEVLKFGIWQPKA